MLHLICVVQNISIAVLDIHHRMEGFSLNNVATQNHFAAQLSNLAPGAKQAKCASLVRDIHSYKSQSNFHNPVLFCCLNHYVQSCATQCAGLDRNAYNALLMHLVAFAADMYTRFG